MTVQQPINDTPHETMGLVTSRDGTPIGYRQIGRGPGVVLLHGALQCAENLMDLARALADRFTVYVPDRRGRGRSGPHGPAYGIARECEDVEALLAATGAANVFGLSSGALVALQATQRLPAIRRVALYEPPLSIGGSVPQSWVARYEREVAAGRLGSAFITIMKGLQVSPMFAALPRVLLTPLMGPLLAADARNLKPGATSIKALIPTMHFDIGLAAELEGTLDRFSDVRSEALLLAGSKSPAYLLRTIDALEATIPRSRRIDFPDLDHLGADNTGRPKIVAAELAAFFCADTPKTFTQPAASWPPDLSRQDDELTR